MRYGNANAHVSNRELAGKRSNAKRNMADSKSRFSSETVSNSVQRWSLTEKKDTNINEIGFSVLQDDTINGLSQPNENIENCSPNAHRGIKRTHSKSDICDKNLFNCQESQSSYIFSALTSSSTNSVICSNSSDVRHSVGKSEIVHSLSNNVKFDGERKRSEDIVTSSNLLIKSDYRLNHAESKNYISPLPSCGPHPPFHRHTQSFMRHTTFEDDNNLNEEFADKTHELNIKSLEDSNEHAVEKECFVLNNLSFCNSLKDNCDSPQSEYCSSQNENAFSKLLDENMLSIFQWLPKQTLVRCMLVCKRWHRLALDSRLWSRICLGGKVLKSGVIPSLMSRHPIVLRLANSQLVSPVIPPDVVSMTAWRVQFLDLSAASVSSSCLATILNFSSALLRLSLEGLTLSETASTALGNLKQLKVLNLALTTGLGKEGARSITKLKNLEALNVAWTGFKPDEMQLLCKGLACSIQRLNLSGFRKSLTEDMVTDVVARCPNLLELDLSDCVMLGENLMPILKKLMKLEHLAVSRCYKLQIADINILNSFPSLQCVDIFGLATLQTMQSFQCLLPKIQINNFIHSGIARPTVGNRRTSIWGLRTRD